MLFSVGHGEGDPEATTISELEGEIVDVVDVVMVEPERLVVVRTTTDVEAEVLGTGTTVMIEVVIVDPAEFVVVMRTVSLDTERGGIE